MIDIAPIGYLSPAHLSEEDRLLVNRYARAGEPVKHSGESGSIFFLFLSLDLAVQLEELNNSEDLHRDLHLLRSAGFSVNFCNILGDAFHQNLKYVLFHEDAPTNQKYRIVSDEVHVYDHR